MKHYRNNLDRFGPLGMLPSGLILIAVAVAGLVYSVGAIAGYFHESNVLYIIAGFVLAASGGFLGVGFVVVWSRIRKESHSDS